MKEGTFFIYHLSTQGIIIRKKNLWEQKSPVVFFHLFVFGNHAIVKTIHKGGIPGSREFGGYESYYHPV